jgi:uncharacterized membrane protein YkgB
MRWNKDIMIKDFIKDFKVSEKGHGSYRLLGILRWVMVLIFISFGIQKFTPQSADGIALYISNSPLVSWLSIFGIRGESYLLGIIELTTAALLAAGAFIPILSALGSLMGIGTFASSFVFVSCCFWHHCQRKSSRFGRIDVSNSMSGQEVPQTISSIGDCELIAGH